MRKRFAPLALFLALTLLCTGTLPAAAAESAKATTLRLEEKEGTVTVTNARGKALKGTTGSKLYSGYSIATGSASYAWISLDEDVLIKTDENSTVTVKQSGKKLEVLLDSGNLFFNVSRPLADDESLDIRTSSMSTGIRGTSGLVSVTQIAQQTTLPDGGTATVRTSSAHLVVYEGTVTLTYTPAPEASTEGALPAAAPVITQVSAGWQADVVHTITAPTGSAQPGQTTQVTAQVQPVSVKEALSSTGFVAVEVATDEQLRESIAAGAGDVSASDLTEISSNAGIQLAADQAQSAAQSQTQQAHAEEALVQLGKEVAVGTPTVVVPVFTPSVTPPSESGSGSGSGSDSGSDTSPSQPAVQTVTFRYNGTDYAKQSVTNGQKAVPPTLQPTQSGEWRLNGAKYDFTRPVTSDLTLTWVSLD